jgi:hypothetical protein
VKRLVLAVVFSLAGWSCSKNKPVIQSFTADKTTVYSGDTVQLSFAVAGATRVTITPLPGVVTSSPVAVTPTVNVTYTLHAQNDAGEVTQNILISVLPRPNAPTLNFFEAIPSQVKPGSPVTLSWSTTQAQSVQLSDGSSGVPADVVASGQKTVAPLTTTVYTLTVTGPPGSLPAQLTAKAVARVAAVPHIVSFTASPSGVVNQGTAVTLSWTGIASRWSLSDGTTATPTPLGPATSAVVRPSPPSTTYTLTASGVGGTDTKTLTINVAPMLGTKLVYTAPTNLTGMQLMLVDVACASPCTAITLRLVPVVPLTGATLRGVALNVPLDSSKVKIDATSGFVVNSSLFAPDSPVAAKALLGSGPLKDTLVIGAAKKGNGSAAAADFTVTGTTEVAHMVLTLNNTGGKGIVFDGGKVISAVQSAAGRALGVVAVGKLEVQ